VTCSQRKSSFFSKQNIYSEKKMLRTNNISCASE
jgi:hypothetical protein